MIIERGTGPMMMAERIDLAAYVESKHGQFGYGRDGQMACYLWHSELDVRDPIVDEGRFNELDGSGAYRMGRKVYGWNSQGFVYFNRYETAEEARAVMLEAFPLSFDETVEALEALPVVVEQLAGFGIELASSSPGEQLTNVFSLGLIVCEALRTVAHDWGHYRLATALRRLGYGPAEIGADDTTWLVRSDDGDDRLMTEEEVIAAMNAMEEQDVDSWRWGQLATIGRYFYRGDSEVEAVALVEAIGACLDAAELEGGGL